MNIVVRLGEPDDIDSALDVYARSATARRDSLGLAALSEDRIDEARATLEKTEAWFFIALEEDTPIGMAAVLPSHELDDATPVVPGQCYLDLLFVVPEHWGEGVGALLLDTIIADARGRGFERLHLLTHEINETAQRLYARRGFERTGWSRMSRDPANGPVSEWARNL